MDIIEQYIALSRKADRLFSSFCHQYSTTLQCRAGCCQCCTLNSVLPVEAFVLAKAIRNLNPRDRHIISCQAEQEDPPGCPLLFDGLCSVYNSRPLICRTHGAALAYIDYTSQSIEISACPQNFPADYVFDPEKMLFMDELNGELLSINHRFCANWNQKQLRISITEVILRYQSQSACPPGP